MATTRRRRPPGTSPHARSAATVRAHLAATDLPRLSVRADATRRRAIVSWVDGPSVFTVTAALEGLATSRPLLVREISDAARLAAYAAYPDPARRARWLQRSELSEVPQRMRDLAALVPPRRPHVERGRHFSMLYAVADAAVALSDEQVALARQLRDEGCVLMDRELFSLATRL